MLDLFKNKLDKTFVRYVITFLAKYEINPNILTIIGLLSGVISAYFIYKGHFIISIIPIILSASCDICDGWLARATKRVSKFGKILDTISDKYVEGLFGLALAFILKDFLIPGYAWAIIAVFGSIIISLVSNIGDSMTEKKVFKLTSRFDRAILLLIGFLLAGLYGPIYLTYSIVVIAILSHITALTLLSQYYFIFKEDNKN